MTKQAKVEVPKLFKVSHTKMSDFRRCLQRFHWKYIDKYYPPSGIGQIRGTAGHAALADWHVNYDAQASMDKAWGVWNESYALPANEEWDLLYKALLRYYAWSKPRDEKVLKLLHAEQEFEIEFDISPYVGENTEPFLFTGFIDGIVMENDQVWLLEHKFYKRMDNSPLDMDQQVALYLLVSHIMEYQAVGTIYNIIRVADTKVALTEPVVRRRVFRNKLGLAHIQTELARQVQAMQQYTQGGVPYRNPTKDCSWDCPFYVPCQSMSDDGNEPTVMLEKLIQIRRKQDA
jgi:hypothetical protein